MNFYKFPHTPHLVWLGAEPPRQDKVLAEPDAAALIDGLVTVEEKVDGANVGLSLDESGTLRAQNRGHFLGQGEHPQFDPLWPWLAARNEALTAALGDGLILFGEWCFAIHSNEYTHLPDWFLGFDVFDRTTERFWSTVRRDALFESVGIQPVPQVAKGHFTIPELVGLIGPSQLSDHQAEGVYVRRDEGDWLGARAKIVAPEFVQAIAEHWAKGPLRRNRLQP